MANDIGAKISLQGEREFRQAVSEINAGLKVTSSQLALVTAKYSENATSVKALTERNNVLEKTLEAQRQKVEVIRQALQKATENYGEADKRTINWQISLNKAEAELIKTEKELKDNSEALKQATEDMKKFGLAEDETREQSKQLGDVLNNLINNLGIHLPAGAEKAIQALDNQKAATMALIGISAALISSFSKTTIETAKFADEILTLSSTTGLATDTLQEMQYAAEFIDVSLETMTGAMTRMIRTMGDADRGTKTAMDAFRRLRVSIYDNNLQLKNSEQMFYEVIDALGNIANETERDAIAMQIFGRSARELNPLIEAGSERLKELGVEARNLGYVLDRGTLEGFGQLDDAMQKFNRQTEAFKRSIAGVMLPPLTALFELLNKIDPKIIATVAIIGSIAVVAVTVVKAVGNIASAFKALDPVTLKTTGIIVGVTAALIALSAIIAVIIGKSDELNQTMQNIGKSVGSMTDTVNNAGNNINYGRYSYNPRYTTTTPQYRYASGINYVPTDRIALIHRGEMVVPAYANPYNPEATHTLGGGDTFILKVNAKDIDEVQKMINTFKQLKQTRRAGMVML